MTPNPAYGPDAGTETEYFNVLVNGDVWKRDGKAVEFDSEKSARKAARTIYEKYGKIAQVVPAGTIK